MPALVKRSRKVKRKKKRHNGQIYPYVFKKSMCNLCLYVQCEFGLRVAHWELYFKRQYKIILQVLLVFPGIGKWCWGTV